MQDLETLHGSHLLTAYVVFDSQLTVLVSSPRVELPENLTLLYASDFFASIA